MINSRMRLNLNLFLLFASMVFFFSRCSKDEVLTVQNTEVSNLSADPDDPNVIKLQELGFDISEIMKEDDGYLVQNDMYFSNSMFTSSSSRHVIRGWSYLIDPMYQTDIKVWVSGVTDQGWINAINYAINQWNSGPNSSIHLSLGNSSNYDIKVYMQTITKPGVIAQAVLPYGNNAGNWIRIDPEYNYLSTNKKNFTITHEMGHNLGFMHTNDVPSGVHVAGTPDSDPSSVMHSNTANAGSWTGLNFFDKLLLTLSYPQNSPPAGTVPFYRYFGMSNSDHFYINDWSILGGNISTTTGYRYERIEGYLFPNQVTGTIPLFRYINNYNSEHFYTINFAAMGLGAYGYTYEQIAGYVYATHITGTVPLHRYFSSSIGDHMYTTNPNEMIGNSQYQYEGIECYIYPRPF